VCNIYVYDEKKGDTNTNLKPRTTFKNIPDIWRCPICNAKKESLTKIDNIQAESARKKYILYQTSLGSNSKILTLDKVRRRALKRLQGICAVNKICDGHPDRLCMGQNYNSFIGMGGIGKGLSFTQNVSSLDKIKLKTRLISKHIEPDMSTTFFKRKLQLPVMASSLSGVKASMGGSIQEKEFALAVLQGSKDAGTIGWIGNTCDEGQELTGVNVIKKVGLGIPIFKPQKNSRIKELINMAENSGAIAVGVDLDGIGSVNWERMNKKLFRKSVNELRDLAESTNLPFIAKGIMSVDDALLTIDAGVSGIDVSNHGGRVLDSTRGVAEVLPEIVKAANRKIIISTGGGVRTGFDVLKLLALGADAVLIGRDIIRAATGGGAKGVQLHFDYIKKDLRRGMLMTGCNSISEINKKIIDK
jgi:isopentenyl diphosphate isomerase/L-lactate dehydrogenase-like FMN-dependent dehydrogenase/rubredoxin